MPSLTRSSLLTVGGMIILVCLVFGTVLTLYGCKPKNAENPLRVGVDSTYPPMQFRDEKTGELQGFDFDLIKAVARRLKRPLKLVNVRWDGGIVALVNGQFDLFIASITITEDRAATVNFSDPYFTAGQVILVRADNTSIKGLPDLVGKRVGVCLGTTGDIAMSKQQGVVIVRYDETPAAILDLENGGVEAVVADSVILMWEAANDKRLKLVDRKPFTLEYYGICVKKGRDELLNSVNRALAQIKADGEYDRIYTKWFGRGR